MRLRSFYFLFLIRTVTNFRAVDIDMDFDSGIRPRNYFRRLPAITVAICGRAMGCKTVSARRQRDFDAVCGLSTILSTNTKCVVVVVDQGVIAQAPAVR